MRAFEERFWSRVNIAGPDDCWEWQGALKRGYGALREGGKGGGKVFRAHRVAWALANGREYPPRDVFILHSCHNPKCCNPAHLREGTHLENMADMRAAERQARGTRSAKSKITEEDVLQIRDMVQRGIPLKEIAAMYDVTSPAIWRIVHRKSWGWL